MAALRRGVNVSLQRGPGRREDDGGESRVPTCAEIERARLHLRKTTRSLGARGAARYVWAMRLVIALAAALLATPAPAQEGLRGHGGPVRALAASRDGGVAISGSFDQSAIVWSLKTDTARAVLRTHEGSVNAVAILPDGRFVTAGEDGVIALWRAGDAEPERRFKAHEAPIASLVVSPDGASLASAGWDETARVYAVADGRLLRTLEGHRGQVNAVAFLPDGALATAGYDATLRLWPTDGATARVIEAATPLNALAVLPDGRIAAGGADGNVLLVSESGEMLAHVEAAETPIIALAASPDGASLAAASPRGSVAIIDAASAKVRFTLNGPGLPVWSLAYAPDGRTLLTGGGDRLVRRWDARTGEHIGAVLQTAAPDDLAGLGDTRGAQVFRACAVCHSLRPDGENRAGPTLHGVFGRRAGSVPGYAYSQAFRALDLVWTPQTVARLFELGPQAYTPGTKMPEQTLSSPQDRDALIEFLRAATGEKTGSRP
ncbi:MAG: cytochrome c class [Hyphomicrobiales bacterium]|nr:cytochrome c class [Hyphomicrobiales bacterium]